MRILVVEDNPRIAAFLKKGLGEEGYAVSVAEDGDIGFERAAGEEFDAAVVDVMLPGRTGIELVRELRGRGSARCPCSCSPPGSGPRRRWRGSTRGRTTTSPSPSTSRS